MDLNTGRTLPKSRSNTRISVLTGTSSGAGAKRKSPAGTTTSESTRLVYHHHGQTASRKASQQGRTSGSSCGGDAAGGAGARARGGGQGYGSYQPLTPQPNPVDACLRAGVAGFGWCMVSWLVGFVLLLLEYARQWDVHSGTKSSKNQGSSTWGSNTRNEHSAAGAASGPAWLIFSPFWLGDILALLVLARVLSKVASVRLATPRNRGGPRRMDQGGRERSSGSLNDLGNGGAVVVPVNMDYFPLLQRVVVTSLGGFLVLVLAVAEQVLVCMWYGKEEAGEVAGRGAGGGTVGPLSLVAPLLVLEGLCLLRVTLLRTAGWLSAVT